VRIETRFGEGTSVEVFLPRAEVTIDPQERALFDLEERFHTTKRANVLVVDDDPSVLKSTLRLLNFLGYAAVPAESGDKALGLIASGMEIDLILADVAMPEMNGVELAGAIHSTRPSSPVILVTGHGDLNVLKGFGESQILQKPYTNAGLVDKITKALR
jgi:DNA-binding NtrC family response regulator